MHCGPCSGAVCCGEQESDEVREIDVCCGEQESEGMVATACAESRGQRAARRRQLSEAGMAAMFASVEEPLSPSARVGCKRARAPHHLRCAPNRQKRAPLASGTTIGQEQHLVVAACAVLRLAHPCLERMLLCMED